MKMNNKDNNILLDDVLINMLGAADVQLANSVKCLITSQQKNPYAEVEQIISEKTPQSMLLSLTVKNISQEDLTVESLMPVYLNVKNGSYLQLGGGIQNWTQLAGGLGKGVRDLCDPCFDYRMIDYKAENYVLYGNRKTDKYILFGFTSFLRQNSCIRLHAESSSLAFSGLETHCNTNSTLLKPGESINSETLFLASGNDPSELLKVYVDRLSSSMSEKINLKNITGWSGWDFYQDDISEEKMLENLRFFVQHRQSLPIEYIQLDSGFVRHDGDWLETNDKFPHGLKYIARKIIDAGFKPGLWLCPFLAAPESKVVREHPDWILRKADGNPLEMYGYTSPMVYGLDGSIKAVQDYLENLARQLTEEYQFSYLKLDGANNQVLSELAIPADKSCSNGEALAMGMRAFRNGMKEDCLLLTAFSPGICIGLVDAMRIGEDSGARWDNSKIAKHHGERDRFNGPGEVLRAIAASANHSYMHKKLWINDPDYLVVRQENCNSELSLEEARSWASAVAMSNGSIILSDPMWELPDERIELLEKVLPHSPYPARPVDFFRKNVPSIMAMPAKNASEEWLVVTVTNTDKPERIRSYMLDFAELGLDVASDYLVFEFWKSEFCGIFQEKFEVTDLEPRCCRTFAIRKKRDGIQLLGTDSHISMGAVEIRSIDNLHLNTARRGRDWRAYYYVPQGCEVPGNWNQHAPEIFYSWESMNGN